jgi:FixJ family two-component response regulator
LISAFRTAPVFPDLTSPYDATAASVAKDRLLREGTIISVIDDDDEVRHALSAFFLSVGYDARTFADAETFLASPEVSASDCVVSDIHMPRMSGLDLAHILRERRPEVPIILISAFATPITARLAAKSGVHCVIEKPFDPDALLGRIEEATGAAPPRCGPASQS